MMGAVSKTENYTKRYELAFNTFPEDIKEEMLKIGNKWNYQYLEQNGMAGIIGQQNKAESFAVGKVEIKQIFMKQKDDQTAEVLIQLKGNFSYATEKNADLLYAKFKEEFKSYL